MKIRILGAHAIESDRTGFMSILLDEVLALDTGALATSLSLPEQQKVNAILLTHSHLDHTTGLGSLCLQAFFTGATVEAYAIKDTADAIAAHLFNGVMHPDFTRMYRGENPLLRFHVIETDRIQKIEGYSVLALPVHHTVPAVGYQVTSEDGKSIFYSGDTGPGLNSVWQRIHPQLLILDCGASNKWSAEAIKVGHMTPELLRVELLDFRREQGYIPTIVLVHMIPLFETEIRNEAAVLARELDTSIELGYEGMTIEL